MRGATDNNPARAAVRWPSPIFCVAQAMGSRSEQRTLYLTREPACSSLYKPDPVVTKSMPEVHCASEIGSTTISLSTLDEWALANDIPQIDFIKLDTQGAELDVLRGGEQSLARPYERLGVFRPRRETFEAGIGT